MGIRATFGKSLKRVCFTAFIKCNIKFSNIVNDFNCSRKLCDDVNLKLKLNSVFANFSVYLLKEGTSARQDNDKHS